MKIFSLKIEKYLNEKELSFYFWSVSDDRVNRVNRLYKLNDKNICLFSELFINYLLGKYYNIPFKSIHYDINEYWKPFLVWYSNIHFNISHSWDYIVCALDNLPVWIDVEKIWKPNDDVAKMFYSKEEYAEYIWMNWNDKQRFFYKIWTWKEAYIKCLWKWMSISMTSFTISCNDNLMSIKDYIIKTVEVDNGYMCVVCSKKIIFTSRITQVLLVDL